ncbi:MAG: hypothetical protein QOF76_4394 [Solirubrobacteraceae bacterium]|jgi:exopolysaccharide biosynthesis polyprenyl glycosylphosphotransferase|nr:hypothetical protein [Solirubrobacteraceae bacterium]
METARFLRMPPVDLPAGEPALAEELLGDITPPGFARDSWRRRLLAAADVLGLLTAFAVMWTLVPPAGSLGARLPLLGLVPIWILIHKLLGLYDRDDAVIHRSSLDELPRLMHSAVLGTMLGFLLAPAVLPAPLERRQAALFLVLFPVLVPLWRTLARALVRRLFEPERCVILGTCPAGQIMARKLKTHPEYGVQLVGFLDEPADDLSKAAFAPVLGSIDALERVCRRQRVERVIVAFTADDAALLDIVRRAKRAQLKITVVPRLHEVIGHSVEVDEVEGMTVLSLRTGGRTHSTLMLKRWIDIAGSAAGLILLAPLLLVIALVVKTTSRGPVLYRSRRSGRSAHFDMLKFRTMIDGADELKPSLLALNEAHGPMFKIADDPRITRVGGFLRRTSLDELPQLWNVLRGEMSLVGPRPLVPDEDDCVLGWHRDRLALTPGLTGPWQVTGRTAIPFEEMVRMDYLYVVEWSLWNDIRLLLRTLPVVLFRRGA